MIDPRWNARYPGEGITAHEAHQLDTELAALRDYRLEAMGKECERRKQSAEWKNKPWSAMDADERRLLRAEPAWYHKRHLARLETEKKEREASMQADVDAKVAAAQEQAKRQMRGGFPGSDAEFEEAWPELLRQWQINEALAALNQPKPSY